MTEDKVVTKERVEKASRRAPKAKVPDMAFQKKLIARLEGFEAKMEALQQENKLLNDQMKLKEKLSQDPLSYTKGVASNKPEGANVIPSYSARLMKMMEEDDKMVEGKFEFKEITRPKEAKGSTITFHYRKYPGKPVQTFTLMHNTTVQLPLGVANHINGELGGCKYAVHKHVMDKNGTPIVDSLGESVHRMGFHSTKFL